MSNHISWDKFKILNSDNPQNAFEDLTRIFFKLIYVKNIYCALPSKNSIHPGFECEPIKVGHERIGFQSKFTSSSPYNLFIKSLRVALKKYKGKVDRIILFTNRNIDTSCQSFNQIMSIGRQIGATIEFVGGKDILDIIENDDAFINVRESFFNIVQLSDGWFYKNASLSLEQQKEKYEFGGFHLNTESVSKMVEYVFENDFIITSNKVIDNIITKFNKHKNLVFKNNIEKKYDNELTDLISSNIKLNLTELEFKSVPKFFSDIAKRIDLDIDTSYNDYNTADEIEKECLSEQLDYLYSCRNIVNDIGNCCIGLIDFSICKTHIIEGSFGCGKTHLFKYITNKRLVDNKRTLLLYGESFRYQNLTVEEEILKCVGLSNLSFDSFLSMLEEKGERGCDYTYILIDAINECADYVKWRDSLRKLIEKINKYKFIKLFISLRDSYSKMCFGDDLESLLKDRILYIHKMLGFSPYNNEIDDFLSHFNIKYNSISYDARETLSRPLLLSLFCKINQNKTFDEIKAVDRVDILTKYIEHEENRWNRLNPDICLLQFNKVIFLIGSYIINTRTKSVPLDILLKILSDNGIDAQNIKYLNRSDILEIKVQDNGSKYVVFYYEYFLDKACSDVLIVEDKYQSQNNIIAFIDNNLTFKNIISGLSLILNKFTKIFDNGIDEVLAKLYEKLTTDAFNDVFYEYLEYSLESPFFSYLKLIKEYKKYIYSRQVYNLIWEKIINSSNNFKNCCILDELLMNLSLSNRDYFWTIFVNDSYDGHNENISLILQRLVSADPDKFNDESISLLVWLLTSSNRELRDLSSKKMIKIFVEKPHLIVFLLEKYISVNDPYIVSRLLAAVYGAISLIDYKNKEDLFKIGTILLKKIFTRIPFEDIQVRDYAKNIIEFVQKKGVKLTRKYSRCYPPYKSYRIPNLAIENVEALYPNDNTNTKNFYGTNSIKFSMSPELKLGNLTFPYGDFGRYIFDSKLSDFCLGKNNKEKRKIFLYAYYYIVNKLGYSNELFSKYDRDHYSYRMRTSSTERIGKKYEWLSLFHVLARVSSTYKMNDYFKDGSSTTFNGTWHPFLRDFDPTQLLETSSRQYVDEYDIKQEEFKNFEKNDKNWVQNHKHEFDFQQQIIVTDKNKRQWMALTTTLFDENGKISESRIYQSRWDLLKAVCLKKQNLEKIINSFGNSHDLDNLWNENENYVLFAYDYSWDSAYQKYYSDNNIVDITISHEHIEKSSNRYKKKHEIQLQFGDKVLDLPEGKNDFHTVYDYEKIAEVYRLSHEYLWEAEYDFSKKESIRYDVPSKYLVDLLNIRQVKSGVWVNSDDKVVMCDFRLYKKCNIKGLYVDFDFLKARLPKDLSIFWIARCELLSISNSNSSFNDRLLKTVLVTYDFEKGKFEYHEILE